LENKQGAKHGSKHEPNTWDLRKNKIQTLGTSKNQAMERKNQILGTSMNQEMEQAMNQRTSKEPNTEVSMNQTLGKKEPSNGTSKEPNTWEKKQEPNTWNK
jgi:hypothetical protein